MEIIKSEQEQQIEDMVQAIYDTFGGGVTDIVRSWYLSTFESDELMFNDFNLIDSEVVIAELEAQIEQDKWSALNSHSRRIRRKATERIEAEETLLAKFKELYGEYTWS